jgi:hypothetical protein
VLAWHGSTSVHFSTEAGARSGKSWHYMFIREKDLGSSKCAKTLLARPFGAAPTTLESELLVKPKVEQHQINSKYHVPLSEPRTWLQLVPW